MPNKNTLLATEKDIHEMNPINGLAREIKGAFIVITDLWCLP